MPTCATRRRHRVRGWWPGFTPSWSTRLVPSGAATAPIGRRGAAAVDGDFLSTWRPAPLRRSRSSACRRDSRQRFGRSSTIADGRERGHAHGHGGEHAERTAPCMTGVGAPAGRRGRRRRRARARPGRAATGRAARSRRTRSSALPELAGVVDAHGAPERGERRGWRAASPSRPSIPAPRDVGLGRGRRGTAARGPRAGGATGRRARGGGRRAGRSGRAVAACVRWRRRRRPAAGGARRRWRGCRRPVRPRPRRSPGPCASARTRAPASPGRRPRPRCGDRAAGTRRRTRERRGPRTAPRTRGRSWPGRRSGDRSPPAHPTARPARRHRSTARP